MKLFGNNECIMQVITLFTVLTSYTGLISAMMAHDIVWIFTFYVLKTSNWLVTGTLLSRIVRSYLQHYGYEETLKLLDIAGESTVPPISVVPENGVIEEDSMYALNQRTTLRQVYLNYASGYNYSIGPLNFLVP